jgi:2-dehydropantoate 2-reductase
MRYVIIGAGAIGGSLAGRLAQHGSANRPLLIARSEHGAAIAASGLRLRDPDADVTIAVDVAAGPDDVTLRVDDVLVLATKTHQAETALLEWVDRPVMGVDGGISGTAGELLPVFTALNGVEAERLALRLFRRVFGVCVWLPAVHLSPGEVILRISPTSGAFIIGRYGADADDSDRQLLTTLERDWTARTYTVHVVDDVMRWKYTKLLSNLGNGVQALLGAAPDSSPIVDRLREEAETIYRAAGIEWTSEAEEAEWRGDVFHVRPVPGTPTELGGSSWQSIARGSGSIETDYLNGEIVLIARARGLTAPLNETIQRLSRQAAGARKRHSTLTVAELEALLG